MSPQPQGRDLKTKLPYSQKNENQGEPLPSLIKRKTITKTILTSSAPDLIQLDQIQTEETEGYI